MVFDIKDTGFGIVFLVFWSVGLCVLGNLFVFLFRNICVKSFVFLICGIDGGGESGGSRWKKGVSFVFMYLFIVFRLIRLRTVVTGLGLMIK